MSADTLQFNEEILKLSNLFKALLKMYVARRQANVE